MKRIGIIGTRKRNTVSDFLIVKEAFLEIFEIYDRNCWIVSGHCPLGGDAFAEKIAFDYGIPILICPPKKKAREEYFARNTLIAKYSHILIACLINPHESLKTILLRKTGGAEDTIKKFVKELGFLEIKKGKLILLNNIPYEKVVIV